MSSAATTPTPPPRGPVDASHDRLRAAVDGLEQARQAPRVSRVLDLSEARRLLHPLQIRARAKVLARAREHHYVHAVFTAHALGEQGRQLGDELAVEGVADVGPVERDAQDLVMSFDQKMRHRLTSANIRQQIRRHIRNTPGFQSGIGAL